LHARQLKFIHPVKKEEVIITANLPNNNLWKSF
jgi:23S rRNA pseudouridine1911/1915/1917 synthase